MLSDAYATVGDGFLLVVVYEITGLKCYWSTIPYLTDVHLKAFRYQPLSVQDSQLLSPTCL